MTARSSLEMTVQLAALRAALIGFVSGDMPDGTVASEFELRDRLRGLVEVATQNYYHVAKRYSSTGVGDTEGFASDALFEVVVSGNGGDNFTTDILMRLS